MADAVRIDPGSCTLSGLPLTMPSLSGEASALFWALAWVAQGPRSVGIRIWSDCLVALGQVNGSFGIAGANSVAEHARSLLQAVQVSGIAIEDIRHVRSHQGHPANECVDSFAKWACKRNSVPPAPEQLPFAKAAQTGQLAWWWCVIDSVRCPDHWPLHVGTDFLDQDRFADTCPPTELESCSWFGLPAAGEHTAKGSSVAFGLRLMSVNVQTLASTSAASEEASDQAFERCRRAELGQLRLSIRTAMFACARVGTSMAISELSCGLTRHCPSPSMHRTTSEFSCLIFLSSTLTLGHSL